MILHNLVFIGPSSQSEAGRGHQHNEEQHFNNKSVFYFSLNWNHQNGERTGIFFCSFKTGKYFSPAKSSTQTHPQHFNLKMIFFWNDRKFSQNLERSCDLATTSRLVLFQGLPTTNWLAAGSVKKQQGVRTDGQTDGRTNGRTRGAKAKELERQKEMKVGRFEVSGLYYKSFTIVIYDRNDSMIVIYDCNDCGLYYKSFTIVNYVSV
jgi:hypothetical protein